MKSIKTIRRVYGLIVKEYPRYLWLSLCMIVTEIVIPFVSIFYMEYLADTVIRNRNLLQLLGLGTGYLLVCGILQLTGAFLEKKLNEMGNTVNNDFEIRLNNCLAHMEYTCLEKPEILDKRDQAMEGIKENDGIRIADINQKIISIVSSVAIAAGTFALMIRISFLLLLIIGITITLNLLIEKKLSDIELESWKKWIPLNRRFRMVYDLMYNVSNAQDVRIYNTYDFFLSKAEAYNRDSHAVMKDEGRTTARYSVIERILSMIQFVSVQLFVINRALRGIITIGGYTLYVNAAGNFTKSATAVVQNMVLIQKNLMYMDQYFDFIDLPRQEAQPDRIRAPHPQSIEFRNVSFRYPGTEKDILKNLNVKLSLNEKTGIVGRNGAGKTTFVKLLLGFYRPTEGTIMIDGHDVSECDTESYQELFSAVFQDFNIYPVTIRENITGALVDDEERIYTILDKLELRKKLSGCAHGLDTVASKVIDEEGIDFSGGERQMIAMARAVYKPSDVLVLDEPTASLDAKTESMLYSRYRDISDKKISVFISHRLASCRLCDRILVFNDGSIIQEGSHSQLMSEKDGLYRQMFTLQAKQYASEK